VVHHVGPRVEHRSERGIVPLKIGDQDFDPARRVKRARLPDGVGEDRRPTVFKIIPVDRRNDDVTQAERADGMRDTSRLVRVGGRRPAVGHGAVRARPGANLSENHECGCAVVPAFADIRALRFLAHRVEVELAHQALEARVVGRPRRAHFQPVGFRPRDRDERHGVNHLTDYIGRRPAMR